MGDKILVWLQRVAGAAGAFCGWFFGGFDGVMYALLVFMACDYITGVLASAAKGKLSSAIGFKGILKKVSILILVGCAHTIDVFVIGSGSALKMCVQFFYICNEGISVMENAGALGLPVPKQLKDAIGKLKGNEG